MRYAQARHDFEPWGCMQSADWHVLSQDDVDVIVARLILFVKEESDGVKTRQGCLDLLATIQRRASTKLKLTHVVMRSWQREVLPLQAEAMPAAAAFAAAKVVSCMLGAPKAAVHVVLAFASCLRIGEYLSTVHVVLAFASCLRIGESLAMCCCLDADRLTLLSLCFGRLRGASTKSR